MKKKQLFRQKSLERLSSPEQLDRLLQVVSPLQWLSLTTMGFFIIIALIWSIFGRIPISVTGRGVLIRPRQVVNLQSPISGQLRDLRIKVGDCITKGTVLAELNQPELQKQLQLQQIILLELQRQDQQLSGLNKDKIVLERQTIQKQRQTLTQRQKDTQDLAAILQNREIIAIQQQRQTIQQRLQNFNALNSTLAHRLEIRKDLKLKGAISDDVVLTAEQSYRDNLNQIADLNAQLQELNVREVKANQSYRESQTQLSDLTAQLKDLDSKEKNLFQQNIEVSIVRKNKLQEVTQSIAQLKVQLAKNSEIISEYSGCILQITANSGQVVTAGNVLGSMAMELPASQMVNLVYFSIKDGKQIQPGMKVQITPDIVKREQFGGIVGKVNTVSSFPVTKDAIIRVVGNTEIAEGLILPGGQMEVLTDLQLDSSTFTGYKWSSSKGPQLQLSSGTTTSVRVTLAEEAPINFILPILRSNSGIY